MPTRARRRVAEPPRDQAPTTFARILRNLVARTPGACAAALVDFEGETVDYAGSLDPFELKVSAAHWQLVLATTRPTSGFDAVQHFCVRAQRRGYFVRRLRENYAVVLVLHPRAAFAVSDRALQVAVMGLSTEAGWPLPRNAVRWFAADVECAHRNQRWRPLRLRVADTWQPLEIIGAVVGLNARERGYRVRLTTGAEIMLIRERLGRWFSDEWL